MLMILLIPLGTASAEAAMPRAVWIWEVDTFRLIDDAAFEKKILDDLQAQGITTLYLYADSYRGRLPIVEQPGKLQDLIARMHDRGFKVEALLGSLYLNTPEYVLPAKANVAREMVQRVLDFNLKSPVKSQFDAIHLDIEPYALVAWKKNSKGIARLYLERSQEWVRMARKARLEIGAAIPFWYDGLEVEWQGHQRPLNEFVQDLYDYVALMDYRNHAEGEDGILFHAKQELAYATKVGKGVVIGLETDQAELDKLTFLNLGSEALSREMAIVERACREQRGYRGLAIHHLKSWRRLRGLS
ncbi:MAG: hypothetical protein HPY65_13620 [Syntrophaceae bacterium]|nr:hypothetical protein [Syntrophaceae bacterium]